MKTNKLLSALLIIAISSLAAYAKSSHKYRYVNGKWEEIVEVAENVSASKTEKAHLSDSILCLEPDSTIIVNDIMFPQHYYLPVVFDYYDIRVTPDSINSNPRLREPDDPMYWVDNAVATDNRYRRFKQQYMINHPELVRYNINTLPVAPKRFKTYVDPATAKITVEEIKVDREQVRSDVGPREIKRKNWLHQFDGLIQFSQAYNSPNWYQGGNNNLNMIANAIYNVKLNQAFHPNILFENTIQYKLALNSAPDDTLRNYSISEDLFQINSKFGVKAAKRWYYSATLQFKTQLLNNYKVNTTDMKASFLSPGELNLGLGMTYEYISPSKKFSINASVAPLSYNLKICTNKHIDERQFGIKEGHTTASQYGSNIDTKLTWKLAYNINLLSRLTAFSDYSYIQADWENTLSFSINKYLSTQLYVHLRYDSQTAQIPDTKWHKLQLKEILSFGFAYKIGTV